MAFKWADAVLESAAAPGTSNVTLGGAVSGGHFTFASFMVNGDTTPYGITDNLTGREIGIGTWTTGGIFQRTTVLASTNGGALVTFTNPVQIWCDAPAAALLMLSSGILVKTGGGNIDGRNVTNLQAANLSGIVPPANGGAGTVSGLLKANGAGLVSAAVSNTDYAPPTIVSASGPSGSGVTGQIWVQV